MQIKGMPSFWTSTPVKCLPNRNPCENTDNLPRNMRSCVSVMCETFEKFTKLPKPDYCDSRLYYKRFLTQFLVDAGIRYNIPFKYRDECAIYQLCIKNHCSFPVVLIAILNRIANDDNVKVNLFKLSPIKIALPRSTLFPRRNNNEDSGFSEKSRFSFSSSTLKQNYVSEIQTPFTEVKKERKLIILEPDTSNSFLQDSSAFEINDSLIDPLRDSPLQANLRPGTKTKNLNSKALLHLRFLSLELDILLALHKKNCTGVISDVLSFLSVEELNNAKRVSKKWQKLVLDDKASMDRMLQDMKEKNRIKFDRSKENQFQANVDSRITRGVLCTSMQNEMKSRTVFEKKHLSKSDAFLELSQSLKKNAKECLQKCPRCCFPSTVLDGVSQCSRDLCKHAFCSKCRGPLLPNHSCSVVNVSESYKSTVIGSKKSKKNLRRL